MTIADFDPQNFGRHYEEPPFMLHFQFKDGGKVCRYILVEEIDARDINCLLYTSPSPRDKRQSRMPSSA